MTAVAGRPSMSLAAPEECNAQRMNLCDFFCCASPGLLAAPEASEIGLEIALGRHLNFRPCGAPSAVEGRGL